MNETEFMEPQRCICELQERQQLLAAEIDQERVLAPYEKLKEAQK